MRQVNLSRRWWLLPKLACLIAASLLFAASADAGYDYVFTANGGTLEFLSPTALPSNSSPLSAFAPSFLQGSADFANPNSATSINGSANFFSFGTVTLNGLTDTYSSVLFEFDNMAFPQAPGTYQGTATLTPTGQAAASPVTASLTITAIDPLFQMSFTGATVPTGGVIGLTLSIANTSGAALTGINFTDALPAGLSVQSLTANTCGGTATAKPADTLISLSGGSLPGSGKCSIQVSLNATGPGQLTNTTSAITTDQTGTGPTATAGITVLAPPTLTTTFGGTALEEDATTPLTFIVTNPNAVSLTGVSFTDVLPASMQLANTSFSDSCAGQTLSIASNNQISFSGPVDANAVCNIKFTATGTALGSYTNTTSSISSNEGGAGASASSSVTVGLPPNFIDFFGTSTIALGGTTSLVFSLENPNAGDVTGVSFTDALPPGLQFASTSLSNSCAGTTATVTSPTQITFSGTLAANVFCAVVATVQGTAPGALTNTSSQLNSEYGATAAATASIIVMGPPVVAATFGVAGLPVGGTTSLSLMLTNPNSAPLTGVELTDNLPPALQLANTAITDTCSGLVANTASNMQIHVAGTLAAGEVCTVVAAVTDLSAGNATDTTSAITSHEGGTGMPASASLVAIAPPGLTAAFGSGTVAVNGSATVTFTLTNSNALALTGVTFTNSLPAGLQLGSSKLVSTCSTGTATAIDATSITFAGTLPPSANCTITASVTGMAAGSYTDTTSTITSTEGGNGAPAAATISVGSAPAVSQAFGAGAVALNGTASLAFTISNPNAIALSGVAFSDTLPTGLQLASLTISDACPGSTAIATSATVIVFSGPLAPKASCTVTASVQGLSAGPYTNTTTPITSNEGGNGPAATANLSVVAPPVLGESFGLSPIALNATTTLTFTVSNPNATSLSGLAFSDALPAGLQLANPTLTSTCAGTASATGMASITFSGPLAANATCSIVATVHAISAGSFTSTTSGITSSEGGSGIAASANIVVIGPPTLAAAFGASTVVLNGNTSLTFTVANPNSVSLTGVGFTDSLPAGLQLASSVLTNACAGLTAIATSDTLITVSGRLSPNSSCTIVAGVKVFAAGSFSSSTSVITSNEGGSGSAATALLGVFGQPGIGESFTPATISPGAASMVTFTISNPVSSAATGLAFTDAMPAGLVVATPSNLSNTCNGTATATPGGNSVALSAGTLAPNGSCSIAVSVTGANEGAYNNVTSPLSSNEGGVGETASATLTVASAVSIAESFSAVSIPSGGSATLSFTATNPNKSTALSGISFTAALTSGLSISTPNGLTGTCGAGTITAMAGDSKISLAAGSLPPSGTCTFSVNVTATATGTLTSSIPTVVADQTSSVSPVSASITVGSVFAVSYAANLSSGDSFINLTNTGENGAMLYGPGLGDPAGNICANVYAFSPDEQLIACCSCLITPGSLYSLSVRNDLLINTYTAAVPTSIVVKVLGTLAGPNGGSTNCAASAAIAQPPTSGLLAWRTTLHAMPSASYGQTEVPFTQTRLSPGELASLSNRCALILGNGGGFGVCNSCRNFGLGAEHDAQ